MLNSLNCWKVLISLLLQHNFERNRCECNESRKKIKIDAWLKPKH
nr:MAG TPA: hypothetical protein [Siphoviridae sp. ctngg6]